MGGCDLPPPAPCLINGGNSQTVSLCNRCRITGSQADNTAETVNYSTIPNAILLSAGTECMPRHALRQVISKQT